MPRKTDTIDDLVDENILVKAGLHETRISAALANDALCENLVAWSRLTGEVPAFARAPLTTGFEEIANETHLRRAVDTIAEVGYQLDQSLRKPFIAVLKTLTSSEWDQVFDQAAEDPRKSMVRTVLAGAIKKDPSGVLAECVFRDALAAEHYGSSPTFETQDLSV